MARRPLLALGPIVMLLLLGGCVVQQHAARRGGAGVKTVVAAVPHGVYKVGSPYQINGVWYYPAEDWSYDETGIASWYGADFDGKYTANGEVFDLNALTAAHRTLPMPSVVQVTNLENGRSIRLRINDRGPYVRGRIIDVSRRAAQLLGFESAGTARVRVRILVPESIQVASLMRRGGDAEVAADAPQPAPIAPVAIERLPVPPGVQVAAAKIPLPPDPPPRPPQAPPPMPATAPPPLPEKVVTVPVQPTSIFIQAGAFAHADNAQRLKAKLAPLGQVEITGAHVNGISLYRVRLGPIGTVDEADRLLTRVVKTGATGARIVVD